MSIDLCMIIVLQFITHLLQVYLHRLSFVDPGLNIDGFARDVPQEFFAQHTVQLSD